ncbi:hypothetical protein UCRPA7_4956 [Phaeoacremonium minimum UCRPA7]|uniref:Uncharacterized protein n=1 Tax=Phaeoacremonium minimum (strain UCR-PA7) TaxID=1286976 RepID=R8BJJ1_PHAM7|nr:hypothetical protein UCRPA7_4956 [Phaeoacremonium minimum UCRPA7]EON99518.1 hypothetical protein UCRPA7_4956 [Phaeoacremonium minimum UCRPA7]
MTSINIHLEAIQTKADDSKEFEGVINDNIEKAIQEQGMRSKKDLESSLNHEWNDRLKEENEKMLERIGKETADVARCISIVNYVGIIAAGIGLTAQVIDIFRYGTAILGSKLVGRGLIKVANKGNGAKVIKGIKKVGGAIAILSVIGDTYLSVYSLSEGGHHRRELQRRVNLQIADGIFIKKLTDNISAIRDLCARRFSVKYIQDLHQKYRSFLQSMYTAVKTDRVIKKKLRMGKITQKDYEERMKDVIEGIAEELKDQCKNVTFNKVYGELQREDNRNNAWTKEDLEEDELRERWDNGEITQFLSSKANEKIEEEGGEVMMSAQLEEDDDEDLEVPEDGDCSSEDDSISDNSDEEN